MSKLYLVFQTEAAAQIALETIYSKMVESVDSPDLLDVTQQQVFDKDELTPSETVQYGVQKRRFPVFGVNAATGVKNVQEGYTTAWATAQTTTQGKFVFQKPDDNLMDGVTNYTVEPFDSSWFAPASE
jgi:hypothetical protein